MEVVRYGTISSLVFEGGCSERGTSGTLIRSDHFIRSSSAGGRLTSRLNCLPHAADAAHSAGHTTHPIWNNFEQWGAERVFEQRMILAMACKVRLKRR